MLGLLSENGPFRPAEGGDVLDLFPYSWTKAANMLFVEQPLFVGYSISDDVADGTTDDATNAASLVRFLLNWLEKFPHYADRPLLLSGESYGASS